MKEYKRANIPLAKILRRNMTRFEKKLWYDFLCNYPIRFQRQKAIGNYIADFYCARAELVLELDGSGHFTPEASERDNVRTAELAKLGIHVVRIFNEDVIRNFNGVCEMIDNIISERLDTLE